MSDSPGQRRITTTISGNAAGLRLDIWLAERFSYHSRNQWQNLIKSGKLLLNERKTRSSRILQENDQVTFIPDIAEPPVTLEYRIVFEDEYFFVVDKCGQLPCHPAGPFFQNTLWYDMAEKYGKVYIVNRLDRETSGLLLMGKSPETAAKLSELFTENLIHKKYFALVYGNFNREIHAKGYLVNDTSSVIRKKRRFVFERPDNDDAETAETMLYPVKSTDSCSLVEAAPSTGRLHQIRATLYSLGYPLLGDKLYGPDDTIYLRLSEDAITDTDWEKLVLPRQALHAYSLEFTHPYTGQSMKFETPLPDDMKLQSISSS